MYENIAEIWDKLSRDIDHAGLAVYLQKLFARFGAAPESIVDLGCGTGGLCVELFKRGYDVTGIDLSVEMLSAAREKAEEAAAGERVLLLNQDVTAFELYGTVDAIVCVSDVVNHILSEDKLARMFRLVKNYLNPGGLFIFDVNTPHKFRNELSGSTFYHADDDFVYIWQNKYSKRRRVCDFDLTCFVKLPDSDEYRRFEEKITEREYDEAALRDMLAASGLDLCGVFGDRRMSAPKPDAMKIFLVSRKLT